MFVSGSVGESVVNIADAKLLFYCQKKKIYRVFIVFYLKIFVIMEDLY